MSNLRDHQDLGRLLHAWQRPDTVVVHDAWWTPVARHADIVLPCATPLERDDLSSAMLGSDRHIVANRAALAPLGQAWPEYDIFAALAQRSGVGEAFTEGRDTAAWLRHLYEASRTGAARGGVELPDFDTFWAAGQVEIPPPPQPHVLLGAFRSDPQAHPLRTPSGRIEIYSETIAGFGYADCPPHPAWLEPAEWLGSPLTADYPLHLITPKTRDRHCSQLVAPGETAPRAPLLLSPGDARARGIATGDQVRVFNDRGEAWVPAQVDDTLREGVVVLPQGRWISRDGFSANVFTHDDVTDMGYGAIFFDCLVEVEKRR